MSVGCHQSHTTTSSSVCGTPANQVAATSPPRISSLANFSTPKKVPRTKHHDTHNKPETMASIARLLRPAATRLTSRSLHPRSFAAHVLPSTCTRSFSSSYSGNHFSSPFPSLPSQSHSLPQHQKLTSPLFSIHKMVHLGPRMDLSVRGLENRHDRHQRLRSSRTRRRGVRGVAGGSEGGHGR